jgi:uncharacterized protein YegL
MATTHVAIVLDRSGSMAPIAAETVTVINEQLEKLGNEKLTDKVTLVTFSTTVDAPHLLNTSDRFSAEDFKPAGWTALYDAIGETITNLQTLEQTDPDTAFLVIIITDGAENMSKNFNQTRLAGLIKELQDSKKWTFVYLGTKADLFTVEQTLNIPFGNVETFDTATAQEVLLNSPKMVSGTVLYNAARTEGRTCSVNYFGKPGLSS